MLSSIEDVSVTFRLPDAGSPATLQITLKPWSQGLKPWNMEEFLYVSGDAVREHFHHVWKYPLHDIRRQVEPLQWALWLADIPDDIVGALRHHGLLQVGALYLTQQFPDLRQVLSVGPLFLVLMDRWIEDVRDDGLDAANQKLQKALTLRRADALRLMSYTENSDVPVSPLRMRFLKMIPATYHFRGHPVRHVAFHNYDAFLPQFFSTRRRFKEKLEIMQAFHWACLSASILFEDAVPLFGKVLRQGIRVRSASLNELFSRLQAIHRSLGKGSVSGLLKGAPSLRFLEKYLKRQERVYHKRRLLGLLPVEPNHFDAPPLPGTPALEPLLSMAALGQEGRYMCNCIASYAHQLKEGNHAAYHMRWPERGTVLLRAGTGGQWQVQDARIEHDKTMGEKGQRFLTAWLSGDSLGHVPDDLPPFYPEAFFADSPYWPDDAYQWDDMADEYANGMAGEREFDDWNDFWLQAETSPWSDVVPESSDTPRLPDALAGWARVVSVEQLGGLGWSDDSSKLAQFVSDPEQHVYGHPDFPLGCVVIHQPSDPAYSMEVVRRHPERQERITFRGLQRLEALRLALLKL